MTTDWGPYVPSEQARTLAWRSHSDAVNLRLIEDWVPPDVAGRVLKTDLFDEATGDGLGRRFGSEGHTLVGIDLSVPVIRGATRRHPRMLVLRADVRALPFRDESFDLVASFSTLDHFDATSEILRGLAAIRRVLRPGGSLVLTLDNLANPKIRLRNALPWSFLERTRLVPSYVGVTFGPREAGRRVADAGFEVIETRAVLHCPRTIAVSAARLPLFAGPLARPRFLAVLSAFEILGKLPTRFLTGHYVAILARRSPGSEPVAPPR